MAKRRLKLDLSSDLNPAQREAVVTTEGPVLVLAGAGSGKTRVITYRVAYLIGEEGVPPERLLALTFTNKAASEMKERIKELVSPSSVPFIGTFHSFCARLLRGEIEKLEKGITSRFVIYDEEDQLSLVKKVIEELGIPPGQIKRREVLAKIGWFKNRMIPVKEMPPGVKSDLIRRISPRYQERLKRANALDFDDLLLMSLELLSSLPEVLAHYQDRYRYILVDEFQDTNRPQYLLLRLLTKKHKNLCVVGDEDQSIYRFRGAEIGNILDFEQDFPGVKLIRLEENYRSTKAILSAASAVIENNEKRKGKTLWTDNEQGDNIHYFMGRDELDEAEFVAREIYRLKASTPLSDIAVLYRTNFQSRVFEEALVRRGIPYTIIGGFRFFERKEIKDIIAYLNLLVNPGDEISLRRAIDSPRRGIGEKTIAVISSFAAERKLPLYIALRDRLDQIPLPPRGKEAVRRFVELIETLRRYGETLPPSRLIKRVAEKSGYISSLLAEGGEKAENRLENIKELIASAREFEEAEGGDLLSFLDRVHLTTDADYLEETEKVILLTFHCAKGLEFGVVFLVGMEEGLFPHPKSLDSLDELEEERRLCYVGMTRAKKRLYLTSAQRRRVFESYRFRTPSRFLTEIPPQLIILPGEERKRKSAPIRERGAGGSLDNIRRFFADRGIEVELPREKGKGEISSGCRVIHKTYGEGVVLEREGKGDEAKITVYFPKRGRKKFVLKYAPIKRAEM
jgi:DNA helicase-2/ATP-dependent DNA helicase PcrA